MRILLVVLALTGLMATSLQARDLTVTLQFQAPVPADGEIVLTLLGDEGRLLRVLRQPAEPGNDADPQTLILPAPQRGISYVQAALVRNGTILAQSPRLPATGRESEFTLSLHALLALAFDTDWLCTDDTILSLRPLEDGLRLARPDSIAQIFTAVPDTDEQYLAEDGSRLVRQEGLLQAEFAQAAALVCARIPHRPLLPVTAKGSPMTGDDENAWTVTLTTEGARVELPESTAPETDIGPLMARRAGDGALIFQSDMLALRLRDDRCRFPTGHIPYPVTAELTLPGTAQHHHGCAGDPLDLMRLGRWQVISLFGIGIAPRLPELPELTIDVDQAQISGRAACNRYVGNIAVPGSRLQISNLGTTRLACPPALRALELRFLDALEQADGFDVDPAGRLLLYRGAVPILVATRA